MTCYYVYAIVQGTISLPNDSRGIANESLSLLTCRGISAIVGTEVNEPPEPRTALVLAHHRLVSKISKCGATLPVQFGSTVRSLERLEHILNEQYETLCEDLDRLAGKVELGVTVLWKQSTDDNFASGQAQGKPAATGTEYMRRRSSEYQREKRLRTNAEAVKESLANEVSKLVADRHEQVLPREGMPLRASYLVEAKDTEEFRRRIEQFSERNGELEVVLVGPWPPYSFVTHRRDDLAGMFGANSG
jgi:hypothetical protein